MTPIETAAADYGPQHLVTQIARWLTDAKDQVGNKYFSAVPVIAKFDGHPWKDIRRALLYLASDRAQLLELVVSQEVDGRDRIVDAQEARKIILEAHEKTCVWFRFRAP